MSVAEIDKAFAQMIAKRGIHNELGISSSAVTTMRSRLKSGETISTEKKLQLLQKTGWTQSDKKYDRKDLISFLNFWRTTSQAARDQGPEYVIDKWEKSPKKVNL